MLWGGGFHSLDRGLLFGACVRAALGLGVAYRKAFTVARPRHGRVGGRAGRLCRWLACILGLLEFRGNGAPVTELVFFLWL